MSLILIVDYNIIVSHNINLKDDRACWMEAIEPGSSASVKPARLGSYEDVSPSTDQEDSDAYSYVQVQHVRKDPPLQAPPIYDEPYTKEAQTVYQGNKIPSIPISTASEHENSNKLPAAKDPSKEASYKRLIQMSEVSGGQDMSKTFKIQDDDEDDDDDIEIYDDVCPEELFDYEDLSTEVSSPPPRSSTVPKHLEATSEISLEHLNKLDPKEAQLWMLIQMQKVIQKMEDVYDTPQISSTKKQKNPQQQKSPDFRHTSGENEKLYVNEFEMTSDVARKDIYVNLDAIGEALAGSNLPPVPPRTYRSGHTESEGASYRDRTMSEVHRATFASEHDRDLDSKMRKRPMSQTLPRQVEDQWAPKQDKSAKVSPSPAKPYAGIRVL